ncbi:MAG: glycosyl transferase [Clostridia bacterium]|nr:glycosyl transferase [Clostridia bacterium]
MIDLRKVFGRDFREKMMYALSILPDKLYLQIFYFSTTGKFINFKNPRGFNEKLQWLKVNDRRPEYTQLVDKLAVRDHIEKVLGEEYLFPLLGKWESFDEIDFQSLPEKFVLKCNHDSGSTKVIKNKSSLTKADFEEMKEFYTERLKRDFFYAGREYPYKGIKPYIIAEQLMVDETAPQKAIDDYKFFCFNGEPKIMFVATDRECDCRTDFFDMDFNHLEFYNVHPNSDKTITKPEKFDEMKEIAAKLSKGMRQVRIDLYELNGKIYFGEFTFFHGGGFRLYQPSCWEAELGNWIDLS